MPSYEMLRGFGVLGGYYLGEESVLVSKLNIAIRLIYLEVPIPRWKIYS